MKPAYREAEWDQLASYLTASQGLHFPPAMFVTGPPGSGKNTLVSSLLENLRKEGTISTYAKVSCVPASFNIREVFESILRDLKRHLGRDVADDDPDVDGVSNFAELVAKVGDILTSKNGGHNCVIALSNAEVLRQLDSFLIPGFLRLAELTQLNICVILISRIPWSRWQIIQCTTVPPLTVTLAPYNKKQLTDLLSAALAESPLACSDKLRSAPEFFKNFAELILGTFYVGCRSFPQFLRVAQHLLPVYMSPVVEGTVDADNTRALWRISEPHIKQALAEIHLREDGLTFQPKTSADDPATLSRPSRLSVELPFYSKFLLISAYLASYNPVKSDKRFFVQNCGRIRKKRNPAAVSSHKRSSQLLGPKPFPLDRMLAIFYVVVDHKVPPRSKILNQVASLVSLQLLTQIGSSDMDSIEIPKYKCNVGLDFIRLVSKNVKFEIHKYLYDATV